jgi:thioredoxin 1
MTSRGLQLSSGQDDVCRITSKGTNEMHVYRGRVGGLLIIVCIAGVGYLAWQASVRQVGVDGKQVVAPVGTRAERDSGAQGDKQMAASSTSTGKIEHADDSNFRQQVLEADGPVLVDFYADWCGPCRMLGPVLEELARENPGARIVKVDVDRSPNAAVKYKIEAIPALRLFRDGKVVSQFDGLASKAELRSMLGL